MLQRVIAPRGIKIEALRADDGDGNENVKKAIRLTAT